MKTSCLVIVLSIVPTGLSIAQETYDFASAQRTRPWRMSTVDAGTCQKGDVYYNYASSKIRVCQTTNVWSDFSGGGGSSVPAAGVAVSDGTAWTTSLSPITTINGVSCSLGGTCTVSSTLSEHVVFRTVSQNTIAGSNFSLPQNNPPTAISVEGANAGDVTAVSSSWSYGTLAFAENSTANTSNSVQGAFPLPSDWSGSTNGMVVVVRWRAASTSGNVLWQIQSQCVAAGGVPGNFGSPQAFTASAAAGVTLQWTLATKTFTTSDLLSGCTADNLFMFRLFRDATNAADTMTGAAELVTASFKIFR